MPKMNFPAHTVHQMRFTAVAEDLASREKCAAMENSTVKTEAMRKIASRSRRSSSIWSNPKR